MSGSRKEVDISTFVIEHVVCVLVVATALQVVGTLILSLFSFFGIKIATSNDTKINGKDVTHVQLSPNWLRLAKVGLILLLLGMFLSGVVSVVTAA